MRVLFPGTFDLFHNGHMHVYKESINLGHDFTFGVAHNADKRTMFTAIERQHIIEQILPGANVAQITGLTARYALINKYDKLIRGVRNGDHDEATMAQYNDMLGMKTLFVDGEYGLQVPDVNSF